MSRVVLNVREGLNESYPLIALLSVSTSWAQGDKTAQERKPKPMRSLNDSRMVAFALEKYVEGPVAELWNCSAGANPAVGAWLANRDRGALLQVSREPMVA